MRPTRALRLGDPEIHSVRTTDNRLHYLHGVVNEGLRMYTVGWGILRQLKADHEMGGFSLPKGSYRVEGEPPAQAVPQFAIRPKRGAKVGLVRR